MEVYTKRLVCFLIGHRAWEWTGAMYKMRQNRGLIRMKKWLLVLAVVLVVAGCEDFPKDSVVVIWAADGGHGSGVVVSQTTVITAKHVAESIGLTVDDQPVIETIMDPDSDVALLILAKPLDRPVAVIDARPLRVGDEVAVVGASFDLPVGVFRGRVCLVNVVTGHWPVVVITDCHAEPGCSGGALVRGNKLVGIHVGHNGSLRYEVPVKEFDLGL